jgi:eukaryotic-like serine/threonine-protein kinase
MGHPTAEQVAQRALDLGLLDERQLQKTWASLGTRNVPLNEFLQLLVRREVMTNFQVERLVKGERSGFFYGPYKVLYLVGTGSFARVFRAVHRQTGEVVAIKALRNRYSDNPVQYNQFVREGKVGCSLRHPNIVPIYDVVSEGRMHFLVMEFVEGWNLRDFVKIRRKVDAVQATRLMIGITDGLRYAFERGLTHRDLKMNNVLVSSACQPKLVDFGLAAMEEPLSDDMLDDVPNARTIDYAALERATSVRKDDTRSDIYFLGCIFYNMLTGQPPLTETRDRLQRLSRSRFLEVVPIQRLDPSIPHWAAMVVNKAMTLDPTRRYQSPAAMLADLHIAERQLQRGDTRPAADEAAVAAGSGKQYSVMVVESDQQMQDLLRERLRRAGYRVLVTADPVRAVSRFRQESAAADCVVFSAQALGESALQMFNELGEDKKTHFVRAMLLLDENQKSWQKHAVTAPHRVVLSMPITLKQLRAALAALVETGDKNAKK